MMSVIVALLVLALAVGAIYGLLKSMGAEGVEVAAPGSCRSGRCGVACKTTEAADPSDAAEIDTPADAPGAASPDATRMPK